ncbi:hypothetical protein AAIB46_20720 [Streptomyces sp. 35M1]|uniref:hypothetical protein n=1 Tax=Streptomyces sp. 35M1 TaxID=3142978 RepID=UPI003990BA80
MFTTLPTLQGTFGMVSSTHWRASRSAMAVVEDGGARRCRPAPPHRADQGPRTPGGSLAGRP